MSDMSAERPSLEQLAERAAGGDGAALGALIEGIQDDVHRLALRMLWHPQDAEDATQEILFKVVTSVATFRGESAFRTWALRVASNHLLNVRRSRVEEQKLTFDAFARDLADGLAPLEVEGTTRDGPDQSLLEEEVKIGCTQAMLLCLDRDERIAYILGDVFELQSDVAGLILEIQPAAFRKRLSRARQQVRDFMRAHCGLVSSAAACRCTRRVPAAVRQGRVNPAHLLFAGRGDASARQLPVLEAVGEMEWLHEIAAVHQSHPRVRAPESVSAQIKGILTTSGLRVLG
jgi:RNA polymerase sigma factor (sigma-70 family)